MVESISELIPLVTNAGRMALNFQNRNLFDNRRLKADGSVITEGDLAVEDFLVDRIMTLYRGVNIVAEERSVEDWREGAWTFAIDPIDGTDNYSQHLPMWCVSVGLLDSRLKPAAGIVYAPALDWLVVSDPGGRVVLNDRILLHAQSVNSIDELSGLFISSRIHRQMDLRRFPGKIRSLGSAALHLAMSMTTPGIVGALQDDGALIWDVAAAHAICLALGGEWIYMSGKEPDYFGIRNNNWRLEEYVLAGKPGFRKHFLPYLALM